MTWEIKKKNDPPKVLITGELTFPPITTGVPERTMSATICSKNGTLTPVDDPIEITTGEPVLVPDEHDTIKVRKLQDAITGIAEQMPEYYNGGSNIQQYLQNNLKYPRIAIDSNIQGTVYVTFVVKKDGSIEDAKILRGISPECDAEALRVIKNMPPWKPGKNNGELVNVQVNLPMRFRLK